MNITQKFAVFLIAALVTDFFPAAASAQSKIFEGPYFGKVTRVVDGDNFEAKVDIWPTIPATVSVRIKGIDAPELFRPECARDKLGAVVAKAALEELLPVDTEILLKNVEADSFSGRVLEEVFKNNPERNSRLETLLLRRQVVVSWDGESPINWCQYGE